MQIAIENELHNVFILKLKMWLIQLQATSS